MYDVNILVNGSRCKQYSHQGKLLVEAKRGSEYVIEVKNDTWSRILAVCSVDGLDVLSGKTATENGNGYVVGRYNSLKLDGFRVSNDTVAKFVFDYKDTSYAASKEDGSERNVGVIGVRIFTEKVQPPPQEIHHHHHWRRRYYDWDNTPINPPYNPPIIWGDTTYKSSTTTGTDNSLGLGNTAEYCCDNIPTKGATKSSTKYDATLGNSLRARSRGITSQKLCALSDMGDERGFDLGTKWGEAKESRVVEVEFEKGLLAFTTNIYYASRQSLIEMGVPLGNEKQVSFPEPFADNGKYAKPPKNWRG
jgi:hypothetical protein